jgi:hypothetical protein
MESDCIPKGAIKRDFGSSKMRDHGTKRTSVKLEPMEVVLLRTVWSM